MYVAVVTDYEIIRFFFFLLKITSNDVHQKDFTLFGLSVHDLRWVTH